MSKKQKYTSSSASKKQENSTKPSSKYRQKQQVILRSNTKYISLIPQDVLYRENLSHLTNRQFQYALEKVLMDLNALLYFSQDDFFIELQQCQSLRSCLQSCLTCLGKNAYYTLSSQRILAINRQKLHIPNNYYYYYQKLHETVLKIYHRISHCTKQEYKQIVYDCWLMDVPKMIDLAMIYCVRVRDDVGEEGFANVDVVKEIIAKAITTNPNEYSKDFDDFINILYQDKLPLIHQDMQLVMNLQEQAMQYAKTNFANPQRSFLITSQKILFQIKDIFTIVTYIYLCFPQAYKQKLATDHQVLEDMIKIFQQFVQSTALWKTGKRKDKFQTNFQAIQQACCENFYLNFKIIKEAIQNGDSLTNHFYSRALNSYSVHSMYFTSTKIVKQHQKIYQQMIKTIVYKIQHDEQMFFLEQAPTNLKFIKLTENQKEAIKKSHVKINQIYDQFEKIFENQQIQRRIKAKIDQFFISTQRTNKNHRFSQENRMVFRGKNWNKNLNKQKLRQKKVNQQKKLLHEEEKLKQKQKLEDLSLDFTEINQSKSNQIDQYQDLSFQELKDSDSSSSSLLQLSFQDDQPQKVEKKIIPTQKQVNKTLYQQQNDLIDPYQYAQLQWKQNDLQQKTYSKSKYLQYKDDYEQNRQQRQEYYQSHPLEYGHYMGRLLQRNYSR